MIVADFETYSELDVQDVGAYRYSLDPTTDVLCLAWAYPDEDDRIRLWHPAIGGLPEEGADDLAELHVRVALGETFEAHNAFFERSVWTNVCERRYGWPRLDPRQLRCSAAKAAARAMPRKLEKLCLALRLAAHLHKDMEGHKVMQVVARPRRPRLDELKAVGLRKGQWSEYRERHGLLWNHDEARLRRTFDYCKQDVRAEVACSRALPELVPAEQEIWFLDQEINWRGVRIDVAGVRRALALADQERALCAEELREISFGAVKGTTDRAGFVRWVHGERVYLGDTKGTTVDGALKDPRIPEHVRRALTVWRSANRSSTKKYDAMLARVCADGRVRDILRYCAAGTGRWAGAGIQVQNFPRGKIKDMVEAWRDLNSMTLEEIRKKHGDPMEFLANALRGAIVADEGKEFVTADFASIEARVLFWCAVAVDALAVIAEGDQQRKEGKPVTKNIYWHMTGAILIQLGTPLPEGAGLDKKHPQYQLGKQAILGLGYQMGGPKFRVTCAGYAIEITEEFADEVKALYRDTYPEVPQLWKDMERAAIEATKRGPGGESVRVGPVRWAMRGSYLMCRLPSGRYLSYCEPEVRPDFTPWGDPCEKLSYMAEDQKTKAWMREDTYGGKLVENVVQAISRDLLADAMMRGSAIGYLPVMTVHDEVVAEVPVGFGGEGAHDLERLLCDLPAWARRLPMDAEGWRGPRYRK